MAFPRFNPFFGAERAASYNTEADFLGALQRSKRPMRDAAFKVRKNVSSKATSIRVGGMIIATGAGCPVHLETDSDPQYTLVIPVHGSGLITQGSETVRFDHEGIIRSSYHRPMSIDYSHYAAVTIRTDVSLLLDALDLEGAARERATERLLDTDLEELPMSIGNIDYYGAIRSTLGMIDAADCNEFILERLGFHRLLTGIIADLTLKADKRLTSGRAASRPLKIPQKDT